MPTTIELEQEPQPAEERAGSDEGAKDDRLAIFDLFGTIDYDVNYDYKAQRCLT